MPLNLNGLEFDLTQATLSGWFDSGTRRMNQGISWSLDIRCAERAIHDHLWKPRLMYDVLDVHPARWQELANTTQAWNRDTDPRDRYPDPMLAPSFSFYLFIHGAMRWGRIGIGARNGTDFALTWNGVADISFDADFATDVPFTLECPIRFAGITVLGRGDVTRDDLARALAAIHPLDDLEPQPLQRRRVERTSFLGRATAALFPSTRAADMVTAAFKPVEASSCQSPPPRA